MPSLNVEKYSSVMETYHWTPKLIESEREYRSCRTALERLLFPERRLSAEEDAMAKLLLHLIDAYEEQHANPPQTTPREVLIHLMEQRELRQKDLVGVFGAVSTVSSVLSGKREINARQARKLAEFFGVTADLFV